MGVELNFKIISKKIRSYFSKKSADEQGTALVEAGLVFPVLLTMLLGTFDVGNAILANQKAIRASQVTADLITRNRVVNDTIIDDSIEAGELSLTPFPVETNFGVDVVSIRFDEDEEPEILWRETRNMSADESVLTDVASLADANNGVVVVNVLYRFEPVFAGFVINEFIMSEVAFSRGRKSATVTKE